MVQIDLILDGFMKSFKFLLCFFFTLLTPIFFLSDNISISLFFNSHYSDFFDKLFVFFSCFGEKYFYIFVGFIMLFVKKNKFLPFPLSFINLSIVVQILKRGMFASYCRPNVVLPQLFPDLNVHIVPYIILEKNFSFPSGHATMIFSLIVLFIYAFEIKNIFAQICLILLGFIVALSRIYLLQHFFCDVYFGAIIGVIITFLTIYIFEKYDLNNKQPFSLLLRLIK